MISPYACRHPSTLGDNCSPRLLARSIEAAPPSTMLVSISPRAAHSNFWSVAWTRTTYTDEQMSDCADVCRYGRTHSLSLLQTSTSRKRPGSAGSWNTSKSRHSGSLPHASQTGRCAALNSSMREGSIQKSTKSVSCFAGVVIVLLLRTPGVISANVTVFQPGCRLPRIYTLEISFCQFISPL